MAFELTHAHKISPKSTLKYDTESVKVIGHFTDEITAYRARKHWMTVLAEHFMLDKERDYEIRVKSLATEDPRIYELSCSFHSACGRYAFWRLINRQAPEAEGRLGIRASKRKQQNEKLISAAMQARGSKHEPWILQGNSKRKSFSEFLNLALRKISCFMF